MEFCKMVCYVRVGSEAPPCPTGKWSYREFLAKYPKVCDFAPGTWEIRIYTRIPVPDPIVKPIISKVAEFYAGLKDAELKKVEVKGNLIRIVFEAKGQVIPILILILAIAALITIDVIEITKHPSMIFGFNALALALLLWLLLYKRGGGKRAK